jgi:hypothetical protein
VPNALIALRRDEHGYDRDAGMMLRYLHRCPRLNTPRRVAARELDAVGFEHGLYLGELFGRRRL